MSGIMSKSSRVPAAGGKSAWRLSPWAILVLCIVLFPYAVSFGSDGATFTLVNGTRYFLHAVINNETIVYIPPGMTITRQTNAYYVVTAEVTYSPGQEKTGSAIRTFQTVVHTEQSGTSSVQQTNDCSDSNHNTCESSSSSTGSSTSSTTIDPITWVVTADTLLSH